MKGLIFFLFLLSTIHGWAQNTYTERDSIEDAQIMEAFFYKTKFQVVLSHEKTLLTSGVNVKMNVLKLGFQLKKEYKFGMFFGLSKTYNTYLPAEIAVSHYETNIFAYGGYFEYVFLENYRWYFGVPISLGRGKVSGLAMDGNNKRISEYDWESANFGVFSMGVNSGLNLNHWLTFALGLGYRFTASANPETKDLLSTPFYTYGVKIKLGHFVTTTFHHKRVNKMKSIYFKDKDNWFANRFKNKHPEFYK